MNIRSKMLEDLRFLYGQEAGTRTLEKLILVLDTWQGRLPVPKRERGQVTHQDSILITYGDQVRSPGQPGLQTLAEFCQRWLEGLVSGVHILPFYPFSSDDGFSVIDYMQVDPALGNWADIEKLGERFRLMFDAVINHISAHSHWFQAFLQDDEAYRDYFIVVEGAPDLSQVIRPRALPLLTQVHTPSGDKAVWTTFSTDQIDLNYANPEVLLSILDVLLFYASQGAEFIRLDAIAYLWKEIGTSCIHLPQTHTLIQLVRRVLDEVAPQVLLISETNVPHEDNISYFGDGSNEAQLVYNFALPPLVLHCLRTADASALARWAGGLALPSKGVTFFNFLASHDGIGLNPARGILRQDEIEALVERALAHGGRVSYKHNPDGTRSPYELNISYFDALSDPGGDEPLSLQAERFLVSQAIMLAVIGVPGIYFHSLFGSRGWPEGVNLTGHNRTINRQKLELETLEREMGTPGHLRQAVFQGYTRLLSARHLYPAFNPIGEQQVVDCGQAVFGLLRHDPNTGSRVLCLHNVSSQDQQLPIQVLKNSSLEKDSLQDIVSEVAYRLPSSGKIELAPYQVLWLANLDS